MAKKGNFGDKYCFFGDWLYASEAERKYGIEKGTITTRIKKQGMTPDEAVTRPVRKHAKRNSLYPFRGRLHTIKFVAQKLNVRPETVRRYHILYGMTMDEIESKLSLRYLEPTYKAKGCKFPDCFNCVLKDCMSN